MMKNRTYDMVFITKSLQIAEFQAALRNFLAIRPIFSHCRITWSSRARSSVVIVVFIDLLEDLKKNLRAYTQATVNLRIVFLSQSI